jgi:CRISPR-associated endonuclease/helicase Cas3
VLVYIVKFNTYKSLLLLIGMIPKFSYIWAKTDKDNPQRWQPLVHHLLDVAASARAILRREPSETRQLHASWLGGDDAARENTLLLLIACHDLGKAAPGFQIKWEGSVFVLPLSGLAVSHVPQTDVNHAYISQLTLIDLLQSRGWSKSVACGVGEALGAHHGTRASLGIIRDLRGRIGAIGDETWANCRRDIFVALEGLFGGITAPISGKLSYPDFMLLAGLTSFADWIGSNVSWFPFGEPDECSSLPELFEARCKLAERALDCLGWRARSPLMQGEATFTRAFPGYSPRPLQAVLEEQVKEVAGPQIILIEAPMGEGKTEAALLAHLQLQSKCGHRGLYVALPTKATGNAMFSRCVDFLNSTSPGNSIDIQLVHGATALNNEFQELRLNSIYSDDRSGTVRAAEWFTNKKRCLLSEYGVGTVDQALISILPVRHQFVRLWGLANRTVVIDEVHAYDTYTGSLLLDLISWLRALGSSVILLSATLPPKFRRDLSQRLGIAFETDTCSYPRISFFRDTGVVQEGFLADIKRRKRIEIRPIGSSCSDIRNALDKELPQDGYIGVVLNTVQRAQELFQLWEEGEAIFLNECCVGKRVPNGDEIFIFHARYPAFERQIREENALGIFGKDGTRRGRRILIATQVIEQSLDLDFDLMVTDLAPIDLILQRAGRLWRHERPDRPGECPQLLVCGLGGVQPESFGSPLWWSTVYDEALLLKTWSLLQDHSSVTLPDEIEQLVNQVYEDEVFFDQEILQERLNASEIEREGKQHSHMIAALHAPIGRPDMSWMESGQPQVQDDEDPTLHASLVARTRLGDMSVSIVPFSEVDAHISKAVTDTQYAHALMRRTISVSSKKVVRKMVDLVKNEVWQESPLLRNSYPMQLDREKRWIIDPSVRLDEQLGLVYGCGVTNETV